MPAWKAAYLVLLKETNRIGEWDMPSYDSTDLPVHSYALYDIDKDGIPELILHFDESESSEYGKIYTFRDGKALCLDIERLNMPPQSFFAFGWNLFSSFPEENGILFRHDLGGKYRLFRWSIQGSALKEAEVLPEADSQQLPVGEAVPGAFDLTEFPAFTLEPLLRYEEWAQDLEGKSSVPDFATGREPAYPGNDVRFFENVLAGKTPVISRLVPRRFCGWMRYYYLQIRPAGDRSTYPEAELNFAMTGGDVFTAERDSYQLQKRTCAYADLNGDGQLEAVCNARFRVGKKGETTVTFFLSEQDGKVYAYGQIDDPVQDVGANGVVHYRYPQKYMEQFTLEGAYRLYFDKENCFRLDVPLEPFTESTVGSGTQVDPSSGLVSLGRFEQDNRPENGPEDISWLVLNRDGSRLLLVSQYALACLPYHGEYAELTWADCSLRAWLNGDFLQTAFNADEQRLIESSRVSADLNPRYSTDPGKNTEDKIFLLSLAEIDRHFVEGAPRRCEATAYAAANGARVNREFGTCWWWTRSPGCDRYYVTDVRPSGELNYVGSDANRDYLCVRPAMWIDLNR